MPDDRLRNKGRSLHIEENNHLAEVHKALIDLYLDVKVRSNDEILALNDDKLELE